MRSVVVFPEVKLRNTTPLCCTTAEVLLRNSRLEGIERESAVICPKKSGMSLESNLCLS